MTDTAKPTLDYASPQRSPRGLSTVGVVLIYSGFLTALIYLLLSQADLSAPMRSQARPQDRIPPLDAQLIALRDDSGNSEIQIRVTSAPQMSSVCRAFFSAEYLRYPHRVFVGTDDRIINNERQLAAVAETASPQWLREHDVSAVYHFVETELGPQLRVQPIR